jgi:N-acetylglucosaminyldiphosphoundecaprenol N-acetyl-beta-D-mannosaminyltransferase
MKILEYNIDTVCPKWPVTELTTVNTLNPHSYCVAKKDRNFKKALQSSDYLMADGIGIVLAIRILNGVKINRTAGADIHKHLLEEAQKNYLKVFYLGADESTLHKIKNRVIKEYPSIQIATFSPPFKSVFSNEENQQMIEAVNQFKPDVLFVGMTAPKQEKWVFANKDKLKTTIISSIGAVFDFYAGTVKRAPNWMITAGLEWLYRFAKEPRRMWRRYLINNTKFLFYVFQDKFLSKEKIKTPCKSG